MSNRKLSTLVAGAFATALASLSNRSTLVLSATIFAAAMSIGTVSHAEDQAAAAVRQVDFGTTTRNILLVHGAWGDGSGYSKVIPRLEAEGFHVVSVQIPLTSFADDVAATQRAIDLETGPVVLVGHSYAGAVITQVGTDPKIKSLVYLAALAPDIGESTASLLGSVPASPLFSQLTLDSFGFLKATDQGYAQDFAEGLPHEEVKVLAATQVPTSQDSLGGVVTVAAWSYKPSWYLITKTDRAVPTALQETLAHRINASITKVDSCHLVMRSHPEIVAEVIEKAAAGIRQ